MLTVDTATLAHNGGLLDARIDTDGVVHIVAEGTLALPIVATGDRTELDVCDARARLEHLRNTLDAILRVTDADLQLSKALPPIAE